MAPKTGKIKLMVKQDADTICAIATATGRAGIGIIRLSGPNALAVGQQITGITPKPRTATCADMRGAGSQLIDNGIIIFFKSPHSFTGEDVVELQVHGGQNVLISLLNQCVALGTRLAEPGEFSERAFLNGKIDLLQAEAIADLIDASSSQAARSAIRTLKGVFSEKIQTLVQDIIRIRVNVEAAIDFSDENIDVLTETSVAEQLKAANMHLTEVFHEANRGLVIKDGITVVLAGAPNAGKSSLLNALAGADTAIVTDIPGTTRDVIRQEISLNGLPIHIIDTAGLRYTTDIVEQEGVRRAISAIKEADLILLVADSELYSEKDLTPILRTLFPGQTGGDTANGVNVHVELSSLIHRLCVIFNKIDLIDNSRPGLSSTYYQDHKLKLFRLSAKTAAGIDELRDHLVKLADYQVTGEGNFSARERHLLALSSAQETLSSAISGVSKHLPLELVAEDLRQVQNHLAAITGEVSSDDLLAEIFSNFCVGK